VRAVQPRKRAIMQRRLPLNVGDFALPMADTQHQETFVNGLKDRVLACAPPFKLNERHFRSFVRVFIHKHLTPPKASDVRTGEEYVEDLDKNSSLKQKFLEAHYENKRHGVSDYHVHKVHGKREKYKKYKSCRGICACPDAEKPEYGPSIEAVEECVYTQLAQYFMKGVAVADFAQELHDRLFIPGIGYVGTDYTSFEVHFSPTLTRICECELYKYMIPDKELARRYCSRISGTHRLQSRVGVSATVSGKRMSGDLVTSLGNGFTNLMIAQYLYFRKNNKYWVGVVEGDDGLFQDVGDIPTADDFAAAGFRIKLNKFVTFSEASFCGVVADEEVLQCICDPREVVTKLSTTHSQLMYGDNNMKGLLLAKCFSLKCIFPACPIITPLADKLIELLKGVKPIYDQDWWERNRLRNKPKLRKEHIHDRTRALMSKLYGVGVSTQLDIESRLEMLQLDVEFEPLRKIIWTHPDSQTWHDYYLKYRVRDRRTPV